jgi:hypothetical protein
MKCVIKLGRPCALALLFSAAPSFSATDLASQRKIEELAGIHLWSSVDQGLISQNEMLWTLSRSLEILREKAPLKNLLAKNPIAVLIQEQRNHSSGFWNKSLIDPDGRPAVKIDLASLRTLKASRKILIHEFTHMEHAEYRPTEESWIREGLAFLAEHEDSLSYGPWLEAGFLFPELPLITSLEIKADQEVETRKFQSLYGQLELFFVYLKKHCGSRIIEEIRRSKSSQKGVELLKSVLSQSGSAHCASFEQIFRNFSRARFEGTLVPADLQSPIQNEKLKLDPYSSTAYAARGPADCSKDDLWMDDRKACLRIRLE